jgi:putative transcriptional regulator
MSISYKKLWKLLIDKDMKKKDLQKAAGISSASVTKLGKNENVNTEILRKICIALQCDIGDIMEVVLDTYVGKIVE